MKKNNNKPAVMVFGELGLIYCVAQEGIPVMLGTDEEDGVNMYSRFPLQRFFFSGYDTEAFIEELIELGPSFTHKPVIVSYDDKLLLNISANRDRLRPYYNFLLPGHDRVLELLDKQLFCELSREYNLPVAPSREVSNKKEVEKASAELNPPYIIKPALRHYWFHKDFSEIVGDYKKAYVCHSDREIIDLYDKISRIHPDAVIQEYIVGDDRQMYDINVYVDEKGKLRGYANARKLRVYPPTAGWGSYVVTVEDREIFDITTEIIEKLELTGLLNIQFKRDEVTNQPMLIEIHTRTSIFDVLGAGAGANMPAMYYRDMNGIEIPAFVNAKVGVKYLNLGRDLRLLVRFRKDVPITMWEWIKSYQGVRVFHDFAFTDPKPFFEKFWLSFKHRMKKAS